MRIETKQQAVRASLNVQGEPAMLVAGDIGAKIDLAIYSTASGLRALLASALSDQKLSVQKKVRPLSCLDTSKVYLPINRESLDAAPCEGQLFFGKLD